MARPTLQGWFGRPAVPWPASQRCPTADCLEQGLAARARPALIGVRSLSASVGDHLAGELMTSGEQAVLDDGVGDGGVRFARPSMVEVAAALPREWVAAGREPDLRLGPVADL